MGAAIRRGETRPFLRWAGSKRWLLDQLQELVPANYGTYFEPFLGGASLFFRLGPERAVLSDTLAPLVDVYRAVREDVETVLALLAPLKPDPKQFELVRSRNSADLAKRASDFIYLNRTAWNALYRVNSHGRFNVPYGRPKTDRLIDADNLRLCANALGRPGVRLITCDFEDALSAAVDGDLVFLDPPYVTGHNNNGFVDYNEQLFQWEDQIRLARVAGELRDKGVQVIATNAAHDKILDLYPTFETRVVERSSTIAGDRTKRGRVSEVLIWSAPKARSG